MGEKNRVTIDKDLKDLIPRYLENRNKDIIKIKEALAQNDIKKIGVVGHQLAGNAGSYGFDQLGNIGKRMENAANAQNIEEITKCLQEIESYMQNLEVIFE
ncbi:MAG: Hpt domain-containing protein [Oligoflexia bacterium]|nr:Hpt domain-containing protein [Oligoflexia bacterium]